MNMLHQIFSWLLSSSLRGSLLALAILCLRAAPGRWLPARWRYALWLPVLLVLVAPVLPATRWSVENLFARKPFAVTVTSSSAPADWATTGEAPGEGPLRAPAHSAGAGTGNLFLIAWMLGAAGILVAGGIGYRRTLLRLSRNRVATSGAIAGAVESAVREVGLRKSPHVLVSTAVESPAVAGLFRPILLLPATFPGGFTRDEARLILLHELTHLKAWDLPLNWLLCVLQALHWFNPLLWLAFGHIRADREAACDACVLCIDALDRRADYGNALLKLQAVAPRFGLSLAFVGIFERAGIRSRIRAIGGHRRGHPAWGGVAIAWIAGLLVLGATHAETPAAPALVSGTSGKPYVDIACAVVEVPVSNSLDGNALRKLVSQRRNRFFNQIRGIKGAHILAMPRIEVTSGREAQVEIGGTSNPSGSPDAMVGSISLDVQPVVVDGKITLHATLSRSSPVDMRLTSMEAGKGTAEIHDVEPGGTGARGKEAKNSQVPSKVTVTGNATLKDGGSLVLMKTEESAHNDLFVFLDVRLVDASGKSLPTKFDP